MRSLLNSLLCVLALAAAAETPAVPDRFTRQGAPSPFWISLSSAVDSHGTLRKDTVPAHMYDDIVRRIADRERRTATSVQAQMSAGEIGTLAPCGDFIITTHRTTVGPLKSWDEVAQSAAAIYLGTVTAVTPGFQGSVPTSVLRVEHLKVFRAAPGFPSDGPLYVLYPSADFSVNGRRVCNAGPDPFYRPMTGDQILIVAHDPPVDREGRFLTTEEEQAIFARGERLVIPARLRPDESRKLRSLDRLASSLVEAPRRSGAEPQR